MSPNGLDAPNPLIFISIGESKYSVQWGPLAEYILSSRNITLRQILTAQAKSEPRFFALAMEMFSAMLAHRYPAGEQPKAQELAARLKDRQFVEAWKVVWDYMVGAGYITLASPNVQKPEQVPASPITQ